MSDVEVGTQVSEIERFYHAQMVSVTRGQREIDYQYNMVNLSVNFEIGEGSKRKTVDRWLRSEGRGDR